MQELYEVLTYPDCALIEQSFYENLVRERGLTWACYFTRYNSYVGMTHTCPGWVKTQVCAGNQPFVAAAIYHRIECDPTLKAVHRLLLMAQLYPQIIDAKRLSTMLYGVRNTSGEWANVNDDDMLMVRAVGTEPAEPQPFTNRPAKDLPRLPDLVKSYAALRCP